MERPPPVMSAFNLQDLACYWTFCREQALQSAETHHCLCLIVLSGTEIRNS